MVVVVSGFVPASLLPSRAPRSLPGSRMTPGQGIQHTLVGMMVEAGPVTLSFIRWTETITDFKAWR